MLSLFRTNQFSLSILLLGYLLLLRLRMLVYPLRDFDFEGGILYEWVMTYVGSASGGTAYILTTLLVFGQAVGVIAFALRYRLSAEITLFAGVFYALLMSLHSDLLYLSPTLLANTFYIALLTALMPTYRKATAAASLFNVGVFAAVATLIEPTYVVFIGVGIMGVLVLRSASLQEWLQVVSGMFVVLFLVGVGYYWYDALPIYIEQLSLAYGVPTLHEITWPGLVLVSIYFFMVAVAVFSAGNYAFKRPIATRNALRIVYLSMLVSALLPWLQPRVPLSAIGVLAVPLALFMGLSFTYMGSRSLADGIHLLLLIVVVVLQYVPVWAGLG